MKTRKAVEYTGMFDLPTDPNIRSQFLRQLFGHHKLIMVCGLPCTGKTTILDQYENSDKHITKWSRQPIFEMLFSGGERDEKYNSYIATFEGHIIPSLFQREFQQVCVDGWNRVRSSRSHFLGLLPQGAGTALAVVCDGPDHMIKERMELDERYGFRTSEDLDYWIKQMRESMMPPKTEEGFDAIVYLNTFGAEGAEYLTSLPKTRK